MKITSKELRKMFLDYFEQLGHTRVPSSPLVPQNDPTLLFVNAGMVQFKDVFLGRDERSYTRATSVQRCVRAGGKHNDLEQVGYTARHHTLFEMLGNFSFGDYFKREAIQYSWNFLTKVLGLPAERLWITVYENDDEAADIWLNELKVSKERFSRCGEKDNFWSMGDTGPCGPCSEIFYDHGAHIAGGPPGSPDQDGDRYVEIWNLVFMQYDRLDSGDLEPLPKPSVDTGMGLERLCAVLQGVHNNYDTDLFISILQAIAKLSGQKDLTNTSMRVIADHIRACSFLITDGVFPSNEGRGYVLRRIIRRAIRHGHKLGLTDLFFYKLVKPLIEVMGEAYPELVKSQDVVEKVLQQEEQQFAKTLEQGLSLLQQDIQALVGTVIPGATIFKLYDTYGFPPDLTGDIAREQGLQLDMAGFEEEMKKQRQLAQSKSKFDMKYSEVTVVANETQFIGYQHLAQKSVIEALLFDNKTVSKIEAGQEGAIFLQSTPFYAESGGQVGDQGEIILEGSLFKVIDTKKQGKSFAHYGIVEKGRFSVGDTVLAKVNEGKRQATVRNHSATHLLHAALRKILGEHVIQKGSLVEPERLRFDFSHYEPVTAQQLKQIEEVVNEKIRENIVIDTHVMSADEAIAQGAMALFGEKYDSKVRVLQMGDFSKELCGGTHAHATGDIGIFKILYETGIASGIRRIEAVTGTAALDLIYSQEQQLLQISELLKAEKDNVIKKLNQLLEKTKSQEKDIERLQLKLASGSSSDLTTQVVDVDGVKVLSIEISGVDAKTLRNTLDQLKNKLPSAVIVLASVVDDKVLLVTGVTKDLTSRFHAGELINYVAQQVGGKGGGRPDMAQAGGTDPKALGQALQSVMGWIKER